MSNTKNTITINGRIYDARTGAAIDPVVYAAVQRPASQPKAAAVFQDVIRPTVIAPTKPIPQPTPLKKAKPARHHPVTDAHKIHSTNQRAATLMRHVVHKPASPIGTKAVHHAVYADSQVRQVKPQTIPSKNEPRLQRAKAAHQSKLISKFGTGSIPKVVKRAAPISVKTSPVPVVPAVTMPAPQPKQVSHANPVQQASAVNDLFSTAITHARSHEQTSPAKTKRRHRVAKRLGISAVAVNIGASLLIVGILAMFFKLYTLPQTAMRATAKQAGISARLPGYQPSGFAMGKPSSPAPGRVVISFKSNSDDRNYTITQEKSDYDNEGLRNNVVAATQQEYQTYESNGHTIYLYDNANATWVNNGILYKIEGKSSLSPDQALRIAASF